jgi:asparagine synthase (glutamine-hydrolysing)
MSCYFARDRFGQKPLYYFHNEKELLFSSDIRSIWSIKRSSLNLDYDSLDYYLSELSTPQPKTIWKEIKQVKPANYYKFQNGKLVTEHKYWSLDYSQKVDISFEEAVEETERLLTQAILRRTVSDVPIGAFLSGGVDSGLICSLLAKNSSERISTYSVGFEDNDLNELNEARLVSDKFETKHTEIIASSNISKVLDDLVEYFGEPFSDDSNIPTYLVCKEVKKHSTVVLSGDGGDELFGGYHEYLSAFNADLFMQKHNTPLRRKALITVSKIASRIKNTPNLGHLSDFYNLPPELKLHRQIGFPITRNSYFNNNNINFSKLYLNNIWNHSSGMTMADKLLESSMKTRLLNAYLPKVDKSSMLNSLEIRSPFLDYKLAEFSAKIPTNLIYNNLTNKAITKKIAQNIFDKNIHNRPKKGFGLPIKDWLRTDLKTKVFDTLNNNTKICDIGFEKQKIAQTLNDYYNEKKDLTYEVWSLLCLELWLKSYF